MTSITWQGHLNISNQFNYHGGDWHGESLHIEETGTMLFENYLATTNVLGTSYASLVNDGTIAIGPSEQDPNIVPIQGASGHLNFAQGCDVTNNGDFDIYTSLGFTFGGGPAVVGSPIFTNYGSLTVAIDGNGPDNIIGMSFRNAGNLAVLSGMLAFSLDFYQFDGGTEISGGALKFSTNAVFGVNTILGGTGSITIAEGATMLNEGTIHVGRTGNRYGQLSVFGTGDFVTTGTINIAVRGTGLLDYGRLNLTGKASLGGILQLTLNNYVPVQGDQISDLIRWGTLDSIANTFGNGPDGWNLDYGNTSLTITAQ